MQLPRASFMVGTDDVAIFVQNMADIAHRHSQRDSPRYVYVHATPGFRTLPYSSLLNAMAAFTKDTHVILVMDGVAVERGCGGGQLTMSINCKWAVLWSDDEAVHKECMASVIASALSHDRRMANKLYDLAMYLQRWYNTEEVHVLGNAVYSMPLAGKYLM